MTEEKKPAEKKEVDWASVELHYRANKRSLEDIGKEFGISKGRISQVAKKDGWERDLGAKIEAKAKAKVAEEVAKKLALNEPSKQAAKQLGEAFVVEANASIIASAEMVQREDVLLGLSVNRGLLNEIATLSNPRFVELLETLAEEFDESGPGPSGAWKTDKNNELYRYIISLAGRCKMAKDVAASHTTYITTQRKVLRMEDEANKGETTVDALLAGVLASGK